MGPARELCIQLGFYSANIPGEVSHPVTRMPHQTYSCKKGARLKPPKRHRLEELLEEMEELIAKYFEIKYAGVWIFKHGRTEWKFSRRTSSADIIQVTQFFLSRNGRAEYVWGENFKYRYQGPHWPRDKEL